MSKSSPRSTAPSPTQRTTLNHKADQGNANPGTNGTNIAHAKVQGNRGAQLNPNRRPG